MARSSSLALLITPPEEPSDWLRVLKEEDWAWLFDDTESATNDPSIQALVDANIELAEIFSGIIQLSFSKALYNIRNYQSIGTIVDDINHVIRASGKILNGTKWRVKREKEREYISVSDYNKYLRNLRECWKGFIDLSGYAIGTLRFIIENDLTVDPSKISIPDRLRMLDDFVDKFPGVKISQYALKLFPELNRDISDQLSEGTFSALPTQAPALWANEKQPGDTPPTFIQRHYKPWLGNGLTRPDIKRLDSQLYVALSNWLRHNEMPHDLDLPTLKEKNDRWVAKIEAEGRPAMGDMPAREASRLFGVIHRRKGPEK